MHATAVLFLTPLLVCAACTVGDVTGLRADAGPDPTAPDADRDRPDAASALACRDAVADPGNGEHNAGEACIACHAAQGGPDYTLAGTLYAAAAGGATIAGATITVVDADGTELDVVTRGNGNFFTNAPLTFPVRVMASRCPDAVEMIGEVTDGDCNTGGCHAAGAPAGRVHLP